MREANLGGVIVGMALVFISAGASQTRAQDAATPAPVPAPSAPNVFVPQAANPSPSAPETNAPVAPATPTTFQSVFGSSQTPVSMKWGDIRSGWFKFTASEQTEGGVYAQLYGNLLGTNIYYTQGTTISVGSETYLVAYRPETKQMDIAGLMNSYTKPPKPAPLTPNTPLALCLLNVRTMGSLKEIIPLDAQRESQAIDDVRTDVQRYFTHEEGERGSLVAESNLKQLGSALLKYAQHRDETLPPMKSAAQAKTALFVFAKSNSLFIDPKTRRFYQPNSSLSQHRLGAIAHPGLTIVYYDPSSADGLHSVLYADGHTRRISDADWPRVKRASKIP